MTFFTTYWKHGVRLLVLGLLLLSGQSCHHWGCYHWDHHHDRDDRRDYRYDGMRDYRPDDRRDYNRR